MKILNYKYGFLCVCSCLGYFDEGLVVPLPKGVFLTQGNIDYQNVSLFRLILLFVTTSTTRTTCYCLVLPVLPVTAWYYLLLPATTCYLVLPVTTWYYLLLPVTTCYYLLLPVLCCVLQGFLVIGGNLKLTPAGRKNVVRGFGKTTEL